MKTALKAVALSALMAVGVAANAAVTIDLFSTDQAKLTDTTIGSPVFSEAGNALDTTIIGGFRDLMVEKKTDPFLTGGEASIGVSGGILNFSTDSTVTGTGTVRWDGGGNAGGALNPTGLGGLNIGSPFSDSFELLTVFSDAGFTFVLEAYTDATTWSRVTLQSNAHPLNFPGTATLIPLAAFLDCGFNAGGITVECGGTGPVDFSNVGALQAVIDPLGEFTSLDLSLNQVTVVPEPSSIALVGLALLGGFAASRRRKA